MAAAAGAGRARFERIVAAFVVAALPGTTIAAPDAAPADPPARAVARPPEDGPAAPLPGSEWNDPDSVNWADAPDAARGPVRDRLLERLGERGSLPMAGRIIDRLRRDLDAAAPTATPGGIPEELSSGAAAWPDPLALHQQLARLSAAPAGEWATATAAHLRDLRATAGPADAAAAAALLQLGEDVDAGMALAERLEDQALATATRRAALAVARRVAVWRAASGVGGPDALTAAATGATTARLLDALERFEAAPGTAAARDVHAVLATLGSGTGVAGAAVTRAVGDHYLAPNLRIAVHHDLVARLLPEATVTSGRMQEFVLGRPVRGTQRVERSTDVRFVPDPDEIRVELLVDGVVTSRSVAESGPVAVHSRATAAFAVRKPVTISVAGIAFSRAVGTASNQSRLADIRTDFDSLPIMGPLMRSIARNQHDDLRAEATREVNDKIITRACREVDQHTEPPFREVADRVRERVWKPLVGLGLEPTPVALETTADMATARIRLAGGGQLAAHTPRPRAPADALFSVQVHESAVNNACDRFGLAGRRLTVEALVRTICDRLGVPPRVPDDLPTDVQVAFAAEEPLRIECRDGLVHVRMSLEAIESGRRAWYDIVAGVSYRPVVSGMQILLEREGPVRLSGPGQQGRMELALRTIFGKIFPKERPVALLPAAFTADPRLAGVQAVQAVCTDGWFAVALGGPARAAGPPAAPTAATPSPPARRVTRR